METADGSGTGVGREGEGIGGLIRPSLPVIRILRSWGRILVCCFAKIMAYWSAPMKRISLLVRALMFLVLLSSTERAEGVATTLALVDEGGVNELAISLSIPNFESSNDTTNLSGSAVATIDIDPVTGVVTELTFTGGAVSGTPIVLAGDSDFGNAFGSYSFGSTVLTGSVNTPVPPGVVDNAPGVGDFGSAQHELTINGGTLSGDVISILGNQVVNQDFGASPVTAAGSGIGNIGTVFRADLSNQTTAVFDIVVFVGVASTTDVLAGSTTVTFGVSGTLKLAGQISVPYLPLIFNFSPNPQIVVNGESLGLDYDVFDADTLGIDQGVGGVSPTNLGTRVVTPPGSADTTYTLTASNGNGSVTRTTMVRSVAQGSASYRYVRFVPVRQKGDLPGFPVADGMQMADFQFFDGVTERVPVGVASPGENSPVGEGPGSLLDGNGATKWFDFRTNATVIFDFGSPVTINRYRFRTANDFEERDPVAWCLAGSDDQVTWITIEAITVRQDDFGQEFNHFTPSARQAFTQFIPLPAVPTLPPAMITEFSALPQIVANGATTTIDWDTADAVFLEIDNGVGSLGGGTGSLGVVPVADADTSYTLTAENAAGTGVTAEVVVRSVPQGSSLFRFLRFTPLRLAEELPGFGGANSIQIADFEFLNGAVPVVPGDVSNPGGNNPPGELPVNLLDGNAATKWLDFNKAAVVFDFGAPQLVTGYRWTTGNDEPQRDPVAWRLEGSDDGVNWIVVDSVDRNRGNPEEEISVHAGLARGVSTPLIPVPIRSAILPAIPLFVGDAPYLMSGEPLVLSWEVLGATAVTLDSGAGPVAVAAVGTLSEVPLVDTTYTLTAMTAAGTVVEQFSTVVVTSSLTRICYEGFDLAGDELGLLGDAVVVNDFGNIPLPGDQDRLRITADADGEEGTAWYRRRVDLSQGFQTWFDLHMLGANDSGADGMSFIIQNTPEGTGAEPAGENERGLPTKAFNISFDSYLNLPEPSAAVLQVLEGTTVLATVDLSVVPGINLPGSVSNDLSSDDFGVAPYEVRIAYVPGDFDLFFQGVLVIDSLNVDFGTTDALDGDGRAYVGFSARTGAFSETHDVTRWVLVEGPPAPPLLITEFVVDLDAGTAVFSFTSSEFRTYTIEESSDGQVFVPIATGIPGTAGVTTTLPIPFAETPVKLFRVVDEKP